MLNHFLQNIEGNGSDIGTHQGSLRHMVRAANGSGDNLDLLMVDGVLALIVVVDSGHDVFQLGEAVFRDIVETAYER